MHFISNNASSTLHCCLWCYQYWLYVVLSLRRHHVLTKLLSWTWLWGDKFLLVKIFFLVCWIYLCHLHTLLMSCVCEIYEIHSWNLLQTFERTSIKNLRAAAFRDMVRPYNLRMLDHVFSSCFKHVLLHWNISKKNSFFLEHISE